MSYSRFDRHEHMSSETRREVLDIIMEIGYGENTFMLTNCMYGLFDGYLYDDLLEVAKGAKIDKALYNRVENVVTVIKNYL